MRFVDKEGNVILDNGKKDLWIWGFVSVTLLVVALLGATGNLNLPDKTVDAMQFDHAVNRAINARVACINATAVNRHAFARSICEEADHWGKQATFMFELYLSGQIEDADLVTVRNYQTLKWIELRA